MNVHSDDSNETAWQLVRGRHRRQCVRLRRHIALHDRRGRSGRSGRSGRRRARYRGRVRRRGALEAPLHKVPQAVTRPVIVGVARVALPHCVRGDAGRNTEHGVCDAGSSVHVPPDQVLHHGRRLPRAYVSIGPRGVSSSIDHVSDEPVAGRCAAQLWRVPEPTVHGGIHAAAAHVDEWHGARV